MPSSSQTPDPTSVPVRVEVLREAAADGTQGRLYDLYGPADAPISDATLLDDVLAEGGERS